MKTLVFICSALCVSMFAQSVPPAAGPAKDVSRPNVTLLLSAEDSSGKPIDDLAKDQFSILDNSQSTTVNAIRRVADAPLHLAIVLYASKVFFPQEQAAAIDLVQKVIRPNVDAVFVLNAGGSKPWPNPQIDWQTDKDALAKTIQSLDRDAGIADAFNFSISDNNGGNSRLWHAARQRENGPTVFDVVWAMMKADPRPARRAIVIFREPWAHSPGGDKPSRDYVNAQVTSIIATAQQLKIPICSIGVEDTSLIPGDDKNFGNVYLPTFAGNGAAMRTFDDDQQKERARLYQAGRSNIEQMSADTGGRTFWSAKKNYPDAVDSIVNELKAQYIFTFADSPEGPASPAHTIKLVSKRNDIRMDAPSTYYLVGK